jgi:hypothetical protein
MAILPELPLHPKFEIQRAGARLHPGVDGFDSLKSSPSTNPKRLSPMN